MNFQDIYHKYLNNMWNTVITPPPPPPPPTPTPPPPPHPCTDFIKKIHLVYFLPSFTKKATFVTTCLLFFIPNPFWNGIYCTQSQEKTYATSPMTCVCSENKGYFLYTIFLVIGYKHWMVTMYCKLCIVSITVCLCWGQTNGVIFRVVGLPNHTFTGQT